VFDQKPLLFRQEGWNNGGFIKVSELGGLGDMVPNPKPPGVQTLVWPNNGNLPAYAVSSHAVMD
jgi:hypothetical protein